MNTQTAVTELIDAAYAQHGGQGTSGARGLRMKKVNPRITRINANKEKTYGLRNDHKNSIGKRLA